MAGFVRRESKRAGRIIPAYPFIRLVEGVFQRVGVGVGDPVSSPHGIRDVPPVQFLEKHYVSEQDCTQKTRFKTTPSIANQRIEFRRESSTMTQLWQKKGIKRIIGFAHCDSTRFILQSAIGCLLAEILLNIGKINKNTINFNSGFANIFGYEYVAHISPDLNRDSPMLACVPADMFRRLNPRRIVRTEPSNRFSPVTMRYLSC